ncbi:MAG: hypothetical protein NZ811_00770 [Gammaproteobacteria bacterium]|nr:hypothetical protein [Gammaproteobacteria bacterium]
MTEEERKISILQEEDPNFPNEETLNINSGEYSWEEMSRRLRRRFRFMKMKRIPDTHITRAQKLLMELEIVDKYEMTEDEEKHIIDDEGEEEDECQHNDPYECYHVNIPSETQHCQNIHSDNENWTAPWDNLCHALLFLLYYDPKHVSSITAILLDDICLLLHTLNEEGFFQGKSIEELREQLPKTRTRIIGYRDDLPYFEGKTVATEVYVNADKSQNSKTTDFQTTEERKEEQKMNSLSDPYELYSDTTSFVNRSNNPVVTDPEVGKAFDVREYGKFVKKTINLTYFPISQFLTWFMLCPNWFGHLDFDFRHPGDPTFNDERCIKKFGHTKFVEEHNIQQHELLVYPLNNGTIIYQGGLIKELQNDMTTAFYVKKIEYKVRQKFEDYVAAHWNKINEFGENVLQNQDPQIHVAARDSFFWQTELTLQECYKFAGSSNPNEWCIIDKDIIIDDVTPTTIYHPVSHFTVYNIVQREIPVRSGNGSLYINLTKSQQKELAVKYQSDLVANNGLAIFLMWGADGVNIWRNGNGIFNSFFNVLNSRLHSGTSLWNHCFLPSGISARYASHLLCEEMQSLNKTKQLIWRCSDDLVNDKFVESSLEVHLAVVTSDSSDRLKFQLAPAAHTKNLFPGKTADWCSQTGPRWPSDCRSNNHSLYSHLRKIPSEFRRQVHSWIHRWKHDRPRKTKWKEGVSRGIYVTNSPFGIWRDLQNDPFRWNFISLCSIEYYHTVTIDLCSKLFSHLYKSFHFKQLPQVYDVLLKYIFEENGFIVHQNPINHYGFACVNKQQAMDKYFGKWLHLCQILPFICDWEYHMTDMLSLHLLVVELLLCNSETKRRTLRKKCIKLMDLLSVHFQRNDWFNWPKLRYLKELIDIDLYLFNSIQWIHSLQVEHSHQLPKKILLRRTNQHGLHELKGLYDRVAVYYGLLYSMNGGRYGPHFQKGLSNRLLSLKHPWHPDDSHPFIVNYKFPKIHCTFKQFMTQNDDDMKLTLDQTRDLWNPKVVLTNYQHLTPKKWKETVDHYDIDVSGCRLLLNDVRGELLPQYECKTVRLFDGYKSVTWTLEDSQQYHIKIILNQTVCIMRLRKIFIFNLVEDEDQTESDDDEDENYVALAYGTVYELSLPPAQTETPSYSRFIPTIDKNVELNPKWIIFDSATVVETVLLTHKHVMLTHQQLHADDPNNNHNNNNNQRSKPQNQWKRDWIKAMEKPNIKQNLLFSLKNNVPSSLPCGPVLSCQKHTLLQSVDCDCAVKNHKRWYCNKIKSTVFYVWGAEQGWLPAISTSIRRKHQTAIQSKPPVIL